MFETTIACAKTGCCGCLTGERVGQIFVFCCNECSTEAGRGTLAELAQAEARESAMRLALQRLWENRVAWGLSLYAQAEISQVLSPDASRALAAEMEKLREVATKVGPFLKAGVQDMNEAWVPGPVSDQYEALVDAWLALPSELRDALAAIREVK